MKPYPHSAIANLTQEQREQLYDWLTSHSYPEVIDLARKPASEGGFDIKFHRTTLVRFFDKEREQRQAQELAELAAASDVGAVPERVELLIKAANTRFAQAVYELAKANNNPEDFDRLGRALYHIDTIRVKREELANERNRQAEQKRQWEFDAAREVMRNYVEYEKIHRQPNLDQPEKIWQAREVAFGKPPTQTDTEKHDLHDSVSRYSVHSPQSFALEGRVGAAVPAGRPVPSTSSLPSLPTVQPPSESAVSEKSAVTNSHTYDGSAELQPACQRVLV